MEGGVSANPFYIRWSRLRRWRPTDGEAD